MVVGHGGRACEAMRGGAVALGDGRKGEAWCSGARRRPNGREDSTQRRSSRADAQPAANGRPREQKRLGGAHGLHGMGEGNEGETAAENFLARTRAERIGRERVVPRADRGDEMSRPV